MPQRHLSFIAATLGSIPAILLLRKMCRGIEQSRIPKRKMHVGPLWWSGGQAACLLFEQSNFKSHRSYVVFSAKIFLQRSRISKLNASALALGLWEFIHDPVSGREFKSPVFCYELWASLCLFMFFKLN